MSLRELQALRTFNYKADADEWLQHLHHVRRFLHWTETRTLQAAILRFKGDAYLWWCALGASTQDNIKTLEHLRAALLERFPPASDQVLWSKFIAIKYHEVERIGHFIDRFKILTDKLRLYPQHELCINRFVEGLPHEMQRHVLRSQPSTLQDAFVTASKYEQHRLAVTSLPPTALAIHVDARAPAPRMIEPKASLEWQPHNHAWHTDPSISSIEGYGGHRALWREPL